MKFCAPEVKVVSFSVDDIIATSASFANGLTIGGVVPGATIQFNRDSANVGTIYGSCPLNGLTYGKDFICVSGYNA